MTKKLTLAIETAVGNGSLSLFEDGLLLDGWCGDTQISRSDRFLPVVAEFLDRNRIEKKDLNLIAVSRGPGNFTGARIGLATAFGLKNGLGIPCVGVSVLKAMAVSAFEKECLKEPWNKYWLTAILTDRSDVIQQKFTDRSETEPEIIDIDHFINELESTGCQSKALLENRLFQMLHKDNKVTKGIKNIGDNLSVCIAKAAHLNYASDNLIAIYLK